MTDQKNPVADDTAPFMLAKSSAAYQGKFIGVVSKYAEEANSANGFKKGPDYHAIALMGRVPVKVSAENGPINPGDYLTSSSTPGVAMKATMPGPVVGTATESYSGSGVGQVIAFIDVHYADPGAILATQKGYSKLALTNVLGTSAVATDSGALDPSIVNQLTSSGALTFSQEVEFKAHSIFSALAEFISEVIFKADVTFLGRATFNRDTAGLAMVKTGADSVDISFSRSYAQVPFVNITPTMYSGNDGASQSLLNGDVRYVVQNLSTAGFRVKLNKAAPADLSFSWTALAVKDASQVSSTQPATPTQPASSTQPVSTTPSVNTSPLGSPTPSVSPSPSPSLIPSPSPSVSPVASPTLTLTASPTSSPNSVASPLPLTTNPSAKP